MMWTAEVQWYRILIRNSAAIDVFFSISHRIHGAGIYANIWGILMVNVTIYSIHGSYGIFWCFFHRLNRQHRAHRTELLHGRHGNSWTQATLVLNSVAFLNSYIAKGYFERLCLTMSLYPRCSMYGIFTYKTGWFLSGKCWDSYSSTMEHLGIW